NCAYNARIDSPIARTSDDASPLGWAADSCFCGSGVPPEQTEDPSNKSRRRIGNEIRHILNRTATCNGKNIGTDETVPANSTRAAPLALQAAPSGLCALFRPARSGKMVFGFLEPAVILFRCSPPHIRRSRTSKRPSSQGGPPEFAA